MSASDSVFGVLIEALIALRSENKTAKDLIYKFKIQDIDALPLSPSGLQRIHHFRLRVIAEDLMSPAACESDKSRSKFLKDLLHEFESVCIEESKDILCGDDADLQNQTNAIHNRLRVQLAYFAAKLAPPGRDWKAQVTEWFQDSKDVNAAHIIKQIEAKLRNASYSPNVANNSLLKELSQELVTLSHQLDSIIPPESKSKLEELLSPPTPNKPQKQKPISYSLQEEEEDEEQLQEEELEQVPEAEREEEHAPPPKPFSLASVVSKMAGTFQKPAPAPAPAPAKPKAAAAAAVPSKAKPTAAAASSSASNAPAPTVIAVDNNSDDEEFNAVEDAAVARSKEIAAAGGKPHNAARLKWSEPEERDLIRGVKQHGTHWESILRDPRFRFHSGRTGVHLKDKHRNLVKAGKITAADTGCESHLLEAKLIGAGYDPKEFFSNAGVIRSREKLRRKDGERKMKRRMHDMTRDEEEGEEEEESTDDDSDETPKAKQPAKPVAKAVQQSEEQVPAPAAEEIEEEEDDEEEEQEFVLPASRAKQPAAPSAVAASPSKQSVTTGAKRASAAFAVPATPKSVTKKPEQPPSVFDFVSGKDGKTPGSASKRSKISK